MKVLDWVERLMIFFIAVLMLMIGYTIFQIKG